MKIAFISFYSGRASRGVESFVHELANKLSKSNEISVYQAGERVADTKYKTIVSKIKVDWQKSDTSESLIKRAFMSYWSRRVFRFTVGILNDLKMKQHDVIVPMNGPAMTLPLKLFTLYSRQKIVIIGESGVGWDDRINLYTFPSRFVAISTKALGWTKRINPFVKNTYIPNGVDTNKFKQKGPQIRHGLEGKTILCVSALVPSKRVDRVVRAVSKIEDTSLLIVGSGSQEDQIQELGDKLLGSNRFKILKLPYEEMPKVYRSVDLFTLASEGYYAFEIVLIEAMASGLGVVANDDSIRREIVGDAGLFVDPEDINDYVKKIKQALGKNWGDLPRMQAGKFSWDIVTGKYEELFKELINGY
ncbi:glycosyltransferase [Patescibacteria group bacterium]